MKEIEVVVIMRSYDCCCTVLLYFIVLTGLQILLKERIQGFKDVLHCAQLDSVYIVFYFATIHTKIIYFCISVNLSENKKEK